MDKFDIAIVGAGIVGLAHAFHAAKTGLRVAVFDRNSDAQGASVRNFGMLALSAQATGHDLSSARRSLTYWQEIAPQAGFGLHQAGCMFVAREPEEMAVLEEFAHSPHMALHGSHLVSKEDFGRYCQWIKPDRILGALFNAETWKVDQRQASLKIANWLHSKYGVSFYFSTEVQEVAPPKIITSVGTFGADHTILCGGNEFASLFPEAFSTSGVTSCQLQMMRTHPQPVVERLQPFIMGGLSMSRYSAFSSCKSLQDLVAMQSARFKPYIDHGIHVIVGHELDGSVTIGDSHAYGLGLASQRSSDIDRLILKDVADMLNLPNTRIAERWLGHYAYLPNTGSVKLSPRKGVTIISQTSGQGMTHGFTIAEELIAELVK